MGGILITLGLLPQKHSIVSEALRGVKWRSIDFWRLKESDSRGFFWKM